MKARALGSHRLTPLLLVLQKPDRLGRLAAGARQVVSGTGFSLVASGGVALLSCSRVGPSEEHGEDVEFIDTSLVVYPALSSGLSYARSSDLWSVQ